MPAKKWTRAQRAKFRATIAAKKKMTKATVAAKSSHGSGVGPMRKGQRVIEVLVTETGTYEVVERVVLATAPDMIVAENIGQMLRKG